MALLKKKLANAPKKPAAPKQPATNKRFTPTFDIENQFNQQGNFNQMNYNNNNNFGGGNYGGNFGGGSNTSSLKSKAAPVQQKKPINNINKNQNSINYNFNKGGFGGGMTDSRPIGGGMNMMSEQPDENEPTSPCPHCGRSFRMDVLTKHQKICQKVFQKKRKPFNMQKQRMVDSEQMSLMKMGQKQVAKNPKLNSKVQQKGGIPKWKLQSMEFRQICRGGFGGPVKIGGGGKKTGGIGKGSGGNMPAYTPSVINDGFIPCKFCNRRYNDEAYHKHLAGCERRYKEAQMRMKLQKKPVGKGPVKKKVGKK